MKRISLLLALVLGISSVSVAQTKAFKMPKPQKAKTTKTTNTTKTSKTSRNSKSSARKIEIYCHGDIGPDYCPEFTFEGNSGYYIMEDGGKRTLKLRYSDRSSQYCEIDAYLRGTFIGTFSGHYAHKNQFEGTFSSVKGKQLAFSLYCAD